MRKKLFFPFLGDRYLFLLLFLTLVVEPLAMGMLDQGLDICGLNRVNNVEKEFSGRQVLLSQV